MAPVIAYRSQDGTGWQIYVSKGNVVPSESV